MHWKQKTRARFIIKNALALVPTMMQMYKLTLSMPNDDGDGARSCSA